MVIILGPGFTGKRLARRLQCAAFAPVRGIDRHRDLESVGLQISEWNLITPEAMGLPKHAKIAWTIPPLPEPDRKALRQSVEQLEPARIVYVWSTGVYGNATHVDEQTAVAPSDDRGRARLEEEQWIAAGPWSSLILRAAAIYGPGRGVHAALKEGRVPRGSGGGLVSRVHVHDLAALIHAGLDSTLEGAWPVADEEPCSSDEIIRWCADYLHLNHPGQTKTAGGAITGRSVNGKQICELLGVDLKYPSWRTGVPASLQEESTTL